MCRRGRNSSSSTKAILPTYTIIANSEATSNHSCLDGIKYGDRQPGSSTDEVMINSRTDGFGAHIKRRFYFRKF